MAGQANRMGLLRTKTGPGVMHNLRAKLGGNRRRIIRTAGVHQNDL